MYIHIGKDVYTYANLPVDVCSKASVETEKKTLFQAKCCYLGLKVKENQQNSCIFTKVEVLLHR